MKLLGLVLFTVLLVKGHSQLQCYTCTNCAKAPESSLGSCGTTLPPTDAPGTGSTPIEGSSSASPSTGSSSTGSSSTGSSSTPSSTTPSSSTPSSSTPSSSTPSSSTPSSSTPSSTTESSPSSSPTTESSSSTSPPTASSSATPPETAAISARSSVSRLRRSVRADETWHCFYEEIKGANNAVSINRGCTSNQEYCKNAGDNTCKTCTKDKCNSSSALKLSLFTLFTTLIVVFSVFK